LLVEGDTMWVGCGTNQTGYGLHGSTDGGATWQVVQTEPRLGQFRVSAIARGDDGLLYVAGINAGNGAMVAALDTSVALPTVTPVLRAGNVVGTSFHVGSLALLSEGRILAESLTGLGALYRRDASIGASATMWEDHYYWANGGMPPGYQMQDLVVHDDALYGCGATIAQPPYVFLPPRDDAAPPWALEVVELPHGGTGEMWGVAANDDRVVVVGVDQDADVGKIYVSGTDPYDAAAYAQTDLPAIVGEGDLGTWARGVCMQGDRIAVVGERQPLASDTGLVVLSVDGGASFVDITPTDDVTESVSKCAFTPEGALVVAGAAGLFAIYE